MTHALIRVVASGDRVRSQPSTPVFADLPPKPSPTDAIDVNIIGVIRDDPSVRRSFTEPWRGNDDPRQVETHWGTFDMKRHPKAAARPITGVTQ